jgi:hypothetical protein
MSKQGTAAAVSTWYSRGDYGESFSSKGPREGSNYEPYDYDTRLSVATVETCCVRRESHECSRPSLVRAECVFAENGSLLPLRVGNRPLVVSAAQTTKLSTPTQDRKLYSVPSLASCAIK